MGMAASQARYLALTARKTNTEYEGQQINQARTALANQSANLFNRLLGLEVPVAPKTTDYTEVQYSFSDGTNESVLESWQQLSSADPDYNYIVNHYYYADIFTGAKKLLQDPQVHTKNEVIENQFVDPKVTYNDDGTATVVMQNGSTVNVQPITNAMTQADRELEESFNKFANARSLAYQAGAIPDEEAYGYQDASGTWHFFIKEDLDNLEALAPKITELTNVTPEGETEILGYEITDASGNVYPYQNVTEYLDQTKPTDTKLEESLQEYAKIAGFVNPDGTIDTSKIYARYDENDRNWHFFNSDDFVLGNVRDFNSEVTTYIGNSVTSELTSELTKDQVAELAQILTDCPDSSMNKYLSFNNKGELVYEGNGIYTFDLYGKSYYTTEQDLYDSINAPHDKTSPIDIQSKLAYYNASYVQTKIEATNHALLETDSNGRFTSVRFDDDSIVYTLNTETVTDEAAYQDAMNEYNYKVQQYEKTIADINARTSIIQQEDRTLELRLKQLDTEQNALSVEMDAVKKVIKDNVDKTFKTFSD